MIEIFSTPAATNRDVYLDGKIYLDVTPASFGRADYWNTESEAENNEAEEAYWNHIMSFPSIPCPSPHPFTDGMEVTEGVDYKIQSRAFAIFPNERYVAVPLTKTNKG